MRAQKLVSRARARMWPRGRRHLHSYSPSVPQGNALGSKNVRAEPHSLLRSRSHAHLPKLVSALVLATSLLPLRHRFLPPMHMQERAHVARWAIWVGLGCGIHPYGWAPPIALPGGGMRSTAAPHCAALAQHVRVVVINQLHEGYNTTACV